MGTGYQVADGVYACDTGAIGFINDDLAGSGVGGNTQVFDAQPPGEGPPADGHQQPVEGHRLGLATAFKHGFYFVARHLGLDHPGIEFERQALPFEDAVQGPSHLAVEGGGDLGQHLDHGHRGSQPVPDRAQFQADVAAAHDAQMPGHGVEIKGFGGADDMPAVEFQPFHLDRF